MSLGLGHAWWGAVGVTEFSWIWVWRARVFKAAGGHTSSNSACSRDLCGRGRWQGTCEWALAKSCGVTRLREPARAEGSCLSSRQCSSAILSAASSERDKKISPLTKRRPGKQNRPSDCTIFLSTYTSRDDPTPKNSYRTAPLRERAPLLAASLPASPVKKRMCCRATTGNRL